MKGFPFDENQHLAGRDAVIKRFEAKRARGVEPVEYGNRRGADAACRVVPSRDLHTQRILPARDAGTEFTGSGADSELCVDWRVLRLAGWSDLG